MKDLEVKDSIIKKLNPSTKLVFSVVNCIYIVKSPLYPVSLIILALMVIYMILGKVSFKKVEKMLRPLYILTIISLSLASLISKDYLGFIEPTIKLLLIFTTGILFAFTTTSTQALSFFQTILKPLTFIKIPVNSLTLLLDTTLRFIPIVIEESYRIMDIQKLRSNNKKNLKAKISFVKSFVISLFLQVFNMATMISQAIYLRQYDAKAKRSKYQRNKFRFIDFLLIVLSLLTFYIFK